jgi:hypothetical protein
MRPELRRTLPVLYRANKVQKCRKRFWLQYAAILKHTVGGWAGCMGHQLPRGLQYSTDKSHGCRTSVKRNETRTESSDPGSTSSWPSLRTISEDSPTAMLAVMAARRTSLNITANPTARFVRPAKMDQANAELLKRLFVQTVLPVVCNTHRYFQMLSARSRQRNFHPREDFIELYAL